MSCQRSFVHAGSSFSPQTWSGSHRYLHKNLPEFALITGKVMNKRKCHDLLRILGLRY